MPSKPRTKIWLDRSTLARLRAYRASQWELAMAGLRDVPESGRPGGGLPSWDALVNMLLDAVDAHRERARQQRERRRTKGQCVSCGGAGAVPGETLYPDGTYDSRPCRDCDGTGRRQQAPQ